MTSPVGDYPPNKFGIYDMGGNVWEWVADWYFADYYLDSPRENPQGPATGELKVARGGSWKTSIVGIRTTNRTANLPNVFSSGVSFRCVLDDEDLIYLLKDG